MDFVSVYRRLIEQARRTCTEQKYILWREKIKEEFINSDAKDKSLSLLQAQEFTFLLKSNRYHKQLVTKYNIHHYRNEPKGMLKTIANRVGLNLPNITYNEKPKK